MSRPSAYTEEVADAIVDGLMDGQSLVRICAAEGMPHRATVIRWMSSNEAFATRCARAREAQADYMDDLILDTAVASTNETAQADRVKIAAFQWRAMKLQPKKYGDKTTTEISGPDGGAIEVQERSTRDVAKALFMMLEQAGKGEGE